MSLQTISDAQIAETAFYLWLDEGQPENRAEDHWYQARATLEAPAKPKRRAAAKPKAVKAPTKKAAPKATKTRKAKA